jgi:GH25 family lysozyme M1 (1,4-beta-N-acetylmuramidase)
MAGTVLLFAGGAGMMPIKAMVVDLFHGDAVHDLAAARQWGIRGVIHKASEGHDYVDPAYARRRSDAAAAGLLWGAYHFMRPGDPVAQAARFLQAAQPDSQTLLAIDHEDEGVPLSAALHFMSEVESRAGRQAVLYSGSLIKEQVRKASDEQMAYLEIRRLWLAHYSAKPAWPPLWDSPWLWQFTGDGNGPKPHSVPGLQDDLDINSFAGSAEDLAAQWAGEATSAATA